MSHDGSLTSSATTPRRIDGFLPIERYAAIGDGHTLGLVGADGSIDWLCAPQLDSPSVFGALLDPATGGRFELAPTIPFEVERAYRERTNVLETTFRTAAGSVRVTDAISRPAAEKAPGRELVRQIEGLAGSVPLEWRVEPRFDYGREAARVERHGATLVLASQGDLQLALRSWDAGEPTVAASDAGARFNANEGSTALLALVAVREHPLLVPDRDAVERRLAATAAFWSHWVGRSRYAGGWQAAVERSLLTIGLLADGRTGAIAAAGTTSLPEAIGGSRNYDYRYAWVRDLSFTLDALMRAGLADLTHESFGWLLDATLHSHPRVDPVYRLGGDVLRDQSSIDLAGYRASRPVNVGNAAGRQRQLGGFGDLLETAWLFTRQGGLLHPETGERLADIADLLERIWRNPDAGLWELDDYAQYTTSKIACWSAFERVLDLVAAGHVPARHSVRWRRARDELHAYIERELWSDSKRSYVEKAGSDSLDASCLLAARRRFGDPRGERLNGTIDAVRRELDAGGPLLYRYSGARSEENAFLACSFWCVQALAMAHRFDEAAALLDELIPLANDVGLYAEEIDPASLSLRGNFPQALTHLSLINAAALFEESLAHARDRRPAEERSPT